MGQQIRCGVFVGLGGSGLKVGLQLKRLFLERFGEVPPVFRILVFDTDDERIKETVYESNGRAVELESDREFFHLRFSLAGVARQIDSRPYVKPWFKPEELAALAREEANINKGAPQKVRKVGRLAFFEKYTTVTEHIKAAGDYVRDVNRMGLAKEKGYEIPGENDAGTDFFISTSVCGGTGSGMFIDVGSYIRSLRRDAINDIVEGYLFLPGVFGSTREEDRRAIEANAFASLTELDHFMNAKQYRIEYGSGREAIVTSKPFPYCYLIDGTQMGNTTLKNPRELAKIVAEAIFVRACNPVSVEADSVTVSAGAYTNIEVDGRYAAYSAIGVASRFVPRDELLAYSTSKVASRLLRQLIDPLQREESDSGLARRDADARWSAAVERAAQEFMDVNDLRAYASRLDDVPDGTKVQANLLVNARQLLHTPREELGARLDAIERDRQHTLLPQALDQVRRNRNQLLVDYSLALQRTCAQHADDLEKGVSFVVDFLAKVGVLLERSTQDFSQQERIAADQVEALQTNTERQRSRLTGDSRSWVRWNVINRTGRIGGPTAWADAINRRLQNDIKLKIFEHAADIADTIRGEAASAANVVTAQQLGAKYRQLLNQLRTLGQEFEQQAEQARSSVQRRFTIFEEPVLDSGDFETIFNNEAPPVQQFAERFFSESSTPALHDWMDETPDRLRQTISESATKAFPDLQTMTLEDGIELKRRRGSSISPRSIYNELRAAAVPWIQYRPEDLPPEGFPYVQEILAVGDRERSQLSKEKGDTVSEATTGDLRTAIFYHVEHGLMLRSLWQIDDYRSAYLRELDPARVGSQRPLHLAPEYEFFEDPRLGADRRDMLELLAQGVGSRLLTLSAGLNGIEVRYVDEEGSQQSVIAAGADYEAALLAALRALRVDGDKENMLRRRINVERARDGGADLVERMKAYLANIPAEQGVLTRALNTRIRSFVERLPRGQ